MNFHLSKFGSRYTHILCIFCRNTLQLQISEVQKFFYIKILYFCELRKKSLAVGSQITKLLYLQNKEVYLEHSLQGECFCATSLPFLQSPTLRLRRMTFTRTPRPGPSYIGNHLPGPTHVGRRLPGTVELISSQLPREELLSVLWLLSPPRLWR